MMGRPATRLRAVKDEVGKVLGGGAVGFVVGWGIGALSGFPGNGAVMAGLLCAGICAFVAHVEW